MEESTHPITEKPIANKNQAEENWFGFVKTAQAIHPSLTDEEKIKSVLKEHGVTGYNKIREPQYLKILKDHAAGMEWSDFVISAKALSSFFDEKFLKNFIANRDASGEFHPALVGMYLTQLRMQADKLNQFVEEAIAIDPRFYGPKMMIFVALEHRYGIPNPDDKAGMLTACRMFEEEWRKRYHWAFACPICGAPTVRDSRWDGFFKRDHDLFFGWKCTADPHEEGKPSHFMQYVGERGSAEREQARINLAKKEAEKVILW